MAEYIEREQAINFARSSAAASYNRDDFGAYRGLNAFIATIISIPAADVAPVVWCKDCKLHGNCITEDIFVFSGIKADNAFCCAGKRKGKQDE